MSYLPSRKHNMTNKHIKFLLSLIFVFFYIFQCAQILAVWMLALFMKNRANKLVKASGKELMCVIFTGIILGLATNFFLVATPSTFTCYMHITLFRCRQKCVPGTFFVPKIRYHIYAHNANGMLFSVRWFICTRSQQIHKRAERAAVQKRLVGACISEIINEWPEK